MYQRTISKGESWAGPRPIQTMILLTPQWYHLFSIGCVDSLLSSLFFQILHCFYSIMLGCFNLFITVAPNRNGPASLFSAKDVPLWYHNYFWYLCKKLFTLSGLTDKKILSVRFCFTSPIYAQKWHSIVRFWVQSLWCLMYHRHR